jgi:ubiquinone/menaquinone biosynthesis C-methylase UbiE
MERILDLGCGTGDSWRGLELKVDDRCIVGVDILFNRVQAANITYRDQGWHYLCAYGEGLPFRDESFDGAFCQVALPYMHIPRALRELHRVLKPGAWLRVSLHHPQFTLRELRRAFPSPKPSLFRIFVLLNGIALHFTGRVIGLGRWAESCQTESGMRIAFRRAGFVRLNFRRDGPRFLLDARRDGTGP